MSLVMFQMFTGGFCCAASLHNFFKRNYGLAFTNLGIALLNIMLAFFNT